MKQRRRNDTRATQDEQNAHSERGASVKLIRSLKAENIRTDDVLLRHRRDALLADLQ
jgi:hypothetical protein